MGRMGYTGWVPDGFQLPRILYASGVSLSLRMHEPMLRLSLSMHEPMLGLSIMLFDPNHPD